MNYNNCFSISTKSDFFLGYRIWFLSLYFVVLILLIFMIYSSSLGKIELRILYDIFFTLLSLKCILFSSSFICWYEKAFNGLLFIKDFALFISSFSVEQSSIFSDFWLSIFIHLCSFFCLDIISLFGFFLFC